METAGNTVREIVPTDTSGRFWGEDILVDASVIAGLVGACAAGAELATVGAAGVLPFAYLGGPVVGIAASVAVPILGCLAGFGLAYVGKDAALDVAVGQ